MMFLLKNGICFACTVLTLAAVTPTYHKVTINGNNYCLSKESAYTNSEAKTYCVEIGAELAMFDDNVEYLNVLNKMSRNSTLAIDAWVYINYTLIDGHYSFYWTNEMFNRSLWAYDNPNDGCKDGRNIECCVRLRFNNKGLADHDCTETYAFLCKVIYKCGSGVTICDVTCSNPVVVLECLDGYFHDKTDNTCRDVDECKTNVSQCQQTCNNSVGSFTCGCFEGYTLNSDNRTCADINECSSYNPCQQNCTNNVGSFHCSCFEGFTLKEDNRTCVDIDECSNSSSICQQNCTNTNGSYHCSCKRGYTLSQNGVKCIKLDECLVSRCERQCQNGSESCLEDCLQTSQLCDHDCVNHTGTYECFCRHGYSLNTTSETACHDIDECSLNSSLCEVYCNNTPGSYYCSCPQGFHLSEDRYSCVKFTPHGYCPCSCSFNAQKLLVSKEQMTSYLTTLRKSLEVDTSKLLSTRLLVESQTDERPSSTLIGYVGLLFMSIVLGLLVLPDFIALLCVILNKFKT